MGKEITRRQFLRETLGTTATISAGFFLVPGINHKETVQCKNCGAVNIHTGSYSTYLNYREESMACHDCGVNLGTLKYDIKCLSYQLFSGKNQDDKYLCHLTECCQIPFPNHIYLKKTRKPYFPIKDLKF
ncbi:MAG: hypothetical protein R6T90_00100, partial [Dissulfuribacterales bacterium]